MLKEFVIEIKNHLGTVCDEVSAWFRASAPQDIRSTNLPCLYLFGMDENATRPVMQLEDILSAILDIEGKCRQDDTAQRNRASNFFKAKDRLLKTLTCHEVDLPHLDSLLIVSLDLFYFQLGSTYICCAKKSKWSKFKNQADF